MPIHKPAILFLCTGNSCRSQMAEGFLRALAGDRFEAVSAGTKPVPVHPLAIRVMAEAGVDISGHVSKHLSQFFEERFDYVITVCDSARESCPLSLHAPNQLHWSFPDPAVANGTEEQQLAVFRSVRDQVRERILEFIGLARMASDAVTS